MRYVLRRKVTLTSVVLLALVPALTACAGDARDPDDEGPAQATSLPEAHVPVRVDTIRRMDLAVTVTAPGHTAALKQDRVRAPFASHLVVLRVTDGDHVQAGEVVAQVVSKDSEAALEGARQMLAAAANAADSSDAERAVTVAQRELVGRPLRAPAEGVVLSHAAEVGDYLDEGEVLLTIAEAGAVYFEAQASQADLGAVKPGEQAEIHLPAVGDAPVGAVVHGILPAASSDNLSAPVRLDFRPSLPNITVGLFGTATIVAGYHENAIVVPPSAIIRDDVNGVSRVAVLDSAGTTAHWVAVTTGIQDGDHLEITSPALPVGRLVVVDGQVGLPDGSKVSIQP